LSLWFRDVVFPALGLLPLGGLALGFSISNLIEVGLLLWLLRGRLGGLNGRSLLSGLARMGLASRAMPAVIAGVLLRLPAAATWSRAVIGTAAGGAVYLLVSQLLRVEEWQRFAGILARRLPGR